MATMLVCLRVVKDCSECDEHIIIDKMRFEYGQTYRIGCKLCRTNIPINMSRSLRVGVKYNIYEDDLRIAITRIV